MTTANRILIKNKGEALRKDLDRFYQKCSPRCNKSHPMTQRCRLDFKSGWASSNVVGIICPPVVIGLTELPNSGWAKVHPAHPLAAALNVHYRPLIMSQKVIAR